MNGTLAAASSRPASHHGGIRYVFCAPREIGDPPRSNSSPQVENGYAIWDFRGQEQQRHLVDRFKQFLWRPRPRTLLTKEQQKSVRKNLREYSRGFDEEDAALESNVSAELVQSRKRAVNEWNAWRAKVREETPSKKRKGDEGEDKEEVVELIDEVIEQTEQIIR